MARSSSRLLPANFRRVVCNEIPGGNMAATSGSPTGLLDGSNMPSRKRQP